MAPNSRTWARAETPSGSMLAGMISPRPACCAITVPATCRALNRMRATVPSSRPTTISAPIWPAIVGGRRHQLGPPGHVARHGGGDEQGGDDLDPRRQVRLAEARQQHEGRGNPGEHEEPAIEGGRREVGEQGQHQATPTKAGRCRVPISSKASTGLLTPPASSREAHQPPPVARHRDRRVEAAPGGFVQLCPDPGRQAPDLARRQRHVGDAVAVAHLVLPEQAFPFRARAGSEAACRRRRPACA